MDTCCQAIQTINAETLEENIDLIRKMSPIVHNITNFVVMELTANMLLAVGASPIMAHALGEVEDIVRIANALVINIGTLDKTWVTNMLKAIQMAQKTHIPVILDPVGAGATTLRTSSSLELLETGAVSVVRGNAAEIIALAGTAIESKGVDSEYLSHSAYDAMQTINERYGCVVVVSGTEDLIVNDHQTIKIQNGDPMMSKVTGMGCTATTLIGAFCAVNTNTLVASAHAMATMGITGEVAATNSSGPGSFKTEFTDTLHSLSPKVIKEKLNIS